LVGSQYLPSQNEGKPMNFSYQLVYNQKIGIPISVTKIMASNLQLLETRKKKSIGSHILSPNQVNTKFSCLSLAFPDFGKP
jgi:hypothetical protein